MGGGTRELDLCKEVQTLLCNVRYSTGQNNRNYCHIKKRLSSTSLLVCALKRAAAGLATCSQAARLLDFHLSCSVSTSTRLWVHVSNTLHVTLLQVAKSSRLHTEWHCLCLLRPQCSSWFCSVSSTGCAHWTTCYFLSVVSEPWCILCLSPCVWVRVPLHADACMQLQMTSPVNWTSESRSIQLNLTHRSCCPSVPTPPSWPSCCLLVASSEVWAVVLWQTTWQSAEAASTSPQGHPFWQRRSLQTHCWPEATRCADPGVSAPMQAFIHTCVGVVLFRCTWMGVGVHVLQGSYARVCACASLCFVWWRRNLRGCSITSSSE